MSKFFDLSLPMKRITMYTHTYSMYTLTLIVLCCVSYIIFLFAYVSRVQQLSPTGIKGYNDDFEDTYDYVFDHLPDPAQRQIGLDRQTKDLGEANSSKRYQATWESLDRRPIPGWYDDAKFGIFIHWGVFSVPAFRSEWFWYRWKTKRGPAVLKFMEENYKPGFTYADFARDFTAQFFDANQWAELFGDAGAKYIVFTSKHHDGYSNWPSKYSAGWNSWDVGPGRDLVGELALAIKQTDIRFGLYHSLYEWYNRLYLEDKANKYKTQYYIQNKMLPSLYELITHYQPDVLWSDGAWEAEAEYWNSTQFLSWLYNDSPVKDRVVTNDRWGKGTVCAHGDYFTCQDRYNPGQLQHHKWENCMTIDKLSWGYRKAAGLSEYFSIEELLKTLAETVSCGGNLLMNVGPTAEGRIAPIYEERLRQVGSWLRVNGDAIYKTKPWTHQEDTITKGVWYTASKYSTTPTVYAILLNWPKRGLIELGAPTPTDDTKVSMLGLPMDLKWKKLKSTGLDIALPVLSPATMPCQWAWVLKLEHVE